jgi:hypothetical protein
MDRQPAMTWKMCTVFPTICSTHADNITVATSIFYTANCPAGGKWMNPTSPTATMAAASPPTPR